LDRQSGELIQAAVAEEKVQIARELHDVIAHAVSVIVIQASAAEGMLDISPERAREPLASVQESGRQALGELRRLLAVLRPEVAPYMALSPQPGLRDLQALAVPLREAGLTVDVQLEGIPLNIPAGVDLAASPTY
jgi:signal transduction histidine kinase